MNRIRLPLAAVALALVAACQSTAPTAPTTPQQPSASAAGGGDSISTTTAREGSLIGSGN